MKWLIIDIYEAGNSIKRIVAYSLSSKLIFIFNIPEHRCSYVEHDFLTNLVGLAWLEPNQI